MGDISGKVGNSEVAEMGGKCGEGEVNEKDEHLVDMC